MFYCPEDVAEFGLISQDFLFRIIASLDSFIMKMPEALCKTPKTYPTVPKLEEFFLVENKHLFECFGCLFVLKAPYTWDRTTLSSQEVLLMSLRTRFFVPFQRAYNYWHGDFLPEYISRCLKVANWSSSQDIAPFVSKRVRMNSLTPISNFEKTEGMLKGVHTHEIDEKLICCISRPTLLLWLNFSF